MCLFTLMNLTKSIQNKWQTEYEYINDHFMLFWLTPMSSIEIYSHVPSLHELCCLDHFWTHTCTNNSKMQSFCTLSVFTFGNILNSVQSKQLRPSGVVRQVLVAWKKRWSVGVIAHIQSQREMSVENWQGADVTQFGLWSFVPGLFLHQRDENYNAFLFSALVLCGS